MRIADRIGHPHITARESNVVRVNFNREPDPRAPRFPGAGALRQPGHDEIDDAWDANRALPRFCEADHARA